MRIMANSSWCYITPMMPTCFMIRLKIKRRKIPSITGDLKELARDLTDAYDNVI